MFAPTIGYITLFYVGADIIRPQFQNGFQKTRGVEGATPAQKEI